MTQPIKRQNPLPAPTAPRRPHSFTRHGITVVDDYAWLKDEKWQDVLRDPAVLDGDIRNYLEAENAYTESLLGHTAPLQKKLVTEMRARIKEDDSSVPAPDGPYAYRAPISRARNILPFGCATGLITPTSTIWSRKPTARWCGARTLKASFM